jgi:EAL domain-containing protein (putative c-di-GMP-specific phosphodiesterase class I)
MNPSRDRKKGKTRWLLEHISEATGKWMVAIESFPFIIGRDKTCNLTLESKWVSRRHAEIRTGGGLLWIRDLGSTNGTCVNHKPIMKSELLEVGDIVSFGKLEFCIKSGDFPRPLDGEVTAAIDLMEELPHLALLETRLRKLLREQNVIPHFQPILRFSDLQVIGYEILGRIAQDDLPSDPVELFDVAGYLGCASDLSALFREKGLDLGRKLPESSFLFANTCAVELDHLDILMESLGKSHDLKHSNRVVLEISETAMPHTEDLKQFRGKLKELGIAMAFDDFGVGQTRLVELAKVPPDFLKFDISLIRQIHLAPKRLHQMVFTFVKAARDLGITTLAEGIECLDESETCREIGFEYAQGFYYGRPLPIGELTAA